jgi:ATP-binding cassette subfamily C exporter for protease/lipase
VQAVLDLRRRGKTIVLITHRTSIIGVTNKLLLMRDGAAQMFGPTDQVLAALQEANQKAMAQQQAAQQAQAQAQAQAATAAQAAATTEQGSK